MFVFLVPVARHYENLGGFVVLICHPRGRGASQAAAPRSTPFNTLGEIQSSTKVSSIQCNGNLVVIAVVIAPQSCTLFRKNSKTDRPS